jgi:8-amino-7-oxononanoate synthase
MSLIERWRLELERLKAAGRVRMLTPPTGIDFSSNDYLAYSKLPLRAASVSDGNDHLARSGTASRLLRGHHPIWDEVENALAQWHGAEMALMMTSGYAANEGLLSSIIEPGDLVFSDQCNHASIIDGLRLSKAERIVFPHNDLDYLEASLNRLALSRKPGQEWFVVTESLFGMEADRAPLAELVELAGRFAAHLIVDEAHGTGCFGPLGSGLVDASRLRGRVLATVHTGGKALAVPGAYIVGSRVLRETLVNRCRHLIYSTALPPQVGAWWLDALALVRTDDSSRQTLHQAAARFRMALTSKGIHAGGSDYIATIRVGADADAVAAARQLQEAGFDIRAIRPPTVPPGTARLRISIHADHQLDSLGALANALERICA